MIELLSKPFRVAWYSLVDYHREHLQDDPEVIKLKQERESVTRQAQHRLTIVETRLPGTRGRGIEESWRRATHE